MVAGESEGQVRDPGDHVVRPTDAMASPHAGSGGISRRGAATPDLQDALSLLLISSYTKMENELVAA